MFKKFELPKKLKEMGPFGVYNGYVKIDDDPNESQDIKSRATSYATASGLYHQWHIDKEPYYRLYPAVIESIIKMDIKKLINLEMDQLPYGLDTLEIEIPESYWEVTGFCSCIIQNVSESMRKHNYVHPVEFEDVWALAVQDEDSMLGMSYPRANLRNHIDSFLDTDDEEMLKAVNIFKFIYGVLAIGENEDIVKPLPLSKDKAKYERTLDEKYIEKARRRGVYGFSVGEGILTPEEFKRHEEENKDAIEHGRKAPHLRSACLATYWTGKGRALPKILLRKSSFVNKDLYKQIPQGFYLE